MIVLLGSLLCYGATAQNTVITNTVYVTNTIIVQQPTSYPGQNIGQVSTVVVQQPAPTVIYQPAPVVVAEPVIVRPYPYHPYYYHRPVVSVGIGLRFGGHYHR